MKPSVQENLLQLQSLVSLVVKMIQDDLSNSTSICNQDSMTLGDFKERVKMSDKESIRIKNEFSSVALTLIELDLCERAIKSVNPRAVVIIKEEK